MDDLIHHLIHFLMYSLVLWQSVLGIYLLLKWVNKNWKSKTIIQSSNEKSSTQNIQPVIKIDGKSIGEGIAKKKKDMGPVDVDVKRNVFIDEADKTKIELDEVKKGKVSTQKEKLKKLRGK